ncbi:sensor [Metapseudomonas resinovorans]|uniref:FecR domain-containing protein n=1 Tax=Metapseudomonas resinovorans TaxID=53412 RepID=UPI0009861008|nr:FecR family protein [Pseudomonas resinovorans]GLZ84527.1 sensor [Pseudomonas resinovorans]
MSQVSARALDEAIAWQLCLDSGEATDQERHEFRRWLGAHPEHAQVWQQLSGIDQQLAAAASPHARRALLRGGGVRRRSLHRLAGNALALVLAVGLGLGLLAQQRPLGDYLADERTANGEHRELRLADNSLVQLNSRTALDIDFDGPQRRIYLRSGEILVKTGHDDPRPFIIETDQGRLQPLGTRFLVRRDGEATQLIVLESAVAARPHNGSAERVVRAGEQVWIDNDHLGPTRAAPVGAEAWSRGLLVAEDMPLSQLIDTLSQYHDGYLGLDPGLDDLRISGVFPLNDSDKALAALPPSLPVRIERMGHWWTRVVPTKD